MNCFHKYSGLRRFFVFWASQSVSSLGTAMTNFALIIWAYGQLGTASSITMLAVCSYLPSILFSFAAGTLADRWDKKRVILVSDLLAALGTLTVFILFHSGNLQIWHLYVINFLLSCMNAFQNPAALVAESVIIPRDQYVRASGMQAFANSLITMLTPALATAFLTFGGLQAVLTIDLASFAIAFGILLFFIKIPMPAAADTVAQVPFMKSCRAGLHFLRCYSPLLRIILFFSFVNLLASLSGNGIMPAMVLSRTDGNQVMLGMVSSAVGLGALAGSILVTAARPAKSRTKVIFIACAASFLLCDVLWGIGRNVTIWALAAFAGNLPLPFLSANLTTIMRTKVPLEMQGRVFSARNSLQFITIPIGLFLGGLLSDYVFEPFMQRSSPLQQFLSCLVGTGRGAGMAVLFLITGSVGTISCLWCLKNPIYRDLDT